MTGRKLRLIFGIAFFALLQVYCAGGFYIWLFPPGSDAGWHSYGRYDEVYVGQIDLQGPAKELRVGDKVIAINEINLAKHPGAIGPEYRLPPGSPYSITVLRDGRELTFTWQTVARRRGPFRQGKLVALLFWLSGLLVLLLKA